MFPSIVGIHLSPLFERTEYHQRLVNVEPAIIVAVGDASSLVWALDFLEDSPTTTIVFRMNTADVETWLENNKDSLTAEEAAIQWIDRLLNSLKSSSYGDLYTRVLGKKIYFQPFYEVLGDLVWLNSFYETAIGLAVAYNLNIGIGCFATGNPGVKAFGDPQDDWLTQQGSLTKANTVNQSRGKIQIIVILHCYGIRCGMFNDYPYQAGRFAELEKWLIAWGLNNMEIAITESGYEDPGFADCKGTTPEHYAEEFIAYRKQVQTTSRYVKYIAVFTMDETGFGETYPVVDPFFRLIEEDIYASRKGSSAPIPPGPTPIPPTPTPVPPSELNGIQVLNNSNVFIRSEPVYRQGNEKGILYRGATHETEGEPTNKYIKLRGMVGYVTVIPTLTKRITM